MIQTMKFLAIAIICFLGGISSAVFFKENNHVAYHELQYNQEATSVQKPAEDSGLRESIEDIKFMLAEQSVRLEATEENIGYLLDLNESVVEPRAAEVTYIAEQETQPTQEYYEAESYVNEQLENGHWSAENVQDVTRMSAKLSHQQRTEIGLKIVQAINSGQMKVENIAMPLF